MTFLTSASNDNYEDTFSKLINVSDNNILDQRLLNFVKDQALEKNPEKNSAHSFIKGDENPSKNNSYVDFLYSIENNNHFFIRIDDIDKILSYKDQIIDKKFENLNNKLNSFLKNNNNYLYLHNSVLEKFENTSLITNYIIKGIEEKTQKIKTNSFESILKKEVFEERGLYFNTVTNFFVNNVFVDFSNTSFDEPNNYFLNRRESIDQNRVNYSEENFLKDSLIKIDKSFPFDFIKPIKNTSNDIITQCFINSSRSLYTLSTNCFLNNYLLSETLIKNYDISSLINLTSERSDLNIFRSINEKNNTINYQQILNNEACKYL